MAAAQEWDVRQAGRRVVLVTRLVFADPLDPPDAPVPWEDVATIDDPTWTATLLCALRAAAAAT